ncbi:MAG: hypothetical protein WC676_03400 [Candidatus Omnitrophota bacterium]
MFDITKIIPEVILGTIIGSLITLLGVWLNNSGALKRLKVQLDNETVQRIREREYNIKKEIYLRAVEELAMVKNFILKLPNLDLNVFNDQNFQNISSGISKIPVVANIDTIKVITNLNMYISKSIFSLFPDKLPIEDLRIRINILSTQMDNCSKKRDIFINEMTIANLKGNYDQAYWEKLKSNNDFYTQEFDKLFLERTKNYHELNSLIKRFSSKCFAAIVGMVDLETEAISCIRSELSMDCDIDDYKSSIKRSMQEAEAELNKFLISMPTE